MSWLQQLADDLTDRGIRGQDRRRIVAELRDHIACEPESVERLGDPAALAGMFADELATSRTRDWTFRAFGALALVGVMLAFSQTALNRVGYPGFNHGLSQLLFWPALIGMFVCAQAAFVAGMLAATRAFRRRHAARLPAAELALIARRTRVALVAGGLTAAGTELYVIDFSARLPAWWLASVATAAALTGGGLVLAWRGLSSAGAIVASTPGPAGDIFDELPVALRPLRGRPWLLGAIAALIAGLAFGVLTGRAEQSVFEGIQRGAFEGLAAATGFVLLGRAIGARPGRRRLRGARRLAALPETTQLAGDADREHAEAVVRVSYAEGRLSLEDLTARIEAIHAARTLGELRAAVADLPDF